VIVIDNLATPDRFPRARRVIEDDVLYRQAVPTADDFAVIATHHKGDYVAIRQLLRTEIQFIALVASHKRAQLVLRRLQAEGIAETALARVRAPCGLAIGARTPEEVALAIIAETVMFRRGGQGICKWEINVGTSAVTEDTAASAPGS
jgi:xanthine dehydrogenase accessory factor